MVVVVGSQKINVCVGGGRFLLAHPVYHIPPLFGINEQSRYLKSPVMDAEKMRPGHDSVSFLFPSVLRQYWLGDSKDIQPIKACATYSQLFF